MEQKNYKKTLSFSTTPGIKAIYDNLIINSENNFYKEKRNFELLIAQAISHCDYKRLKIFINKAFENISTEKFNNLTVIYHTIAIITLLTRLAIIEGVDEKEAYSLSDAYLTIDLSNLSNPPLEVICEIADNFLSLIENSKYFKYDSPIVSTTINHIHNNITSTFTLNSLADISQVSPEYLSSHFKNSTGMSLKCFINMEKINYSKLLLISTDLSLLQISLELGYSDQSYFSKIFKKFTNKTPKQFKKENIMKLGRRDIN